MSWSAIASLVLGLLKLAPSLYAAVGDAMQREREARAAQRQREKDARVDEAISQVSSQETAETAENKS